MSNYLFSLTCLIWPNPFKCLPFLLNIENDTNSVMLCFYQSSFWMMQLGIHEHYPFTRIEDKNEHLVDIQSPLFRDRRINKYTYYQKGRLKFRHSGKLRSFKTKINQCQYHLMERIRSERIRLHSFDSNENW